MPLLRSAAFSSLRPRIPVSSIRQPHAARPFSSTPFRRSQGYGDGEGDPKGENPQQQGSSNSTKHNAEHPGPEAPKEGQGSGSGPTKGGSGGISPEEASAQSGGARSKAAEETGSSPTGGSMKGSPKVHDNKVPGGNTAEKQAEVDQHNKEFAQGHDRTPLKSEDKVDKKFWSGQGGSDRQP